MRWRSLVFMALGCSAVALAGGAELSLARGCVLWRGDNECLGGALSGDVFCRFTVDRRGRPHCAALGHCRWWFIVGRVPLANADGAGAQDGVQVVPAAFVGQPAVVLMGERCRNRPAEEELRDVATEACP